MTKPPDWPFRCPAEGWYLSEVDAVFSDTGTVPQAVYGTCKRHGKVLVTTPEAYAPDLWMEDVQGGQD